MKNSFDYEIELVKKFLELNQSKSSQDSITTIEVPVRWGNIDIVEIKNNDLPFNTEQSNVLSKISNSRVFLKTKKNRGISKKSLLLMKGMSKSTIESSLNQLVKVNLIIKKDGLYYRNMEFSFPKVVITGYEAKLIDYKKAVFQAMINKDYVDYSYLIFPIEIAEKICKKNVDFLMANGIGLIGVSTKQMKVLIRARKIKEVKEYSRLVNLVQTNLCLSKKEALIH